MIQQSIQSRIIKTDLIKWRELKFIQQENFKEWVTNGSEKLIESILKYQFIAPFMVWQHDAVNYCLDGRHRFMDLEKVAASGKEVPEMLPATFIDCANMKEAELLGLKSAYWFDGDSNEVLDTFDKTGADFVYSCPPYADLEKYSDDPKDLSNMDYADFKEVYFSIIKKSVAQLKDDRFACFVVGDVRDKKGFYYNFVSDTIQAFKEAGMELYNEIILVNVVGSLAIRVRRQFNGGRKIGKMHQNVLVFYKGDPKKIKENYPELNIGEALDAFENDNSLMNL
jgi:hypothetical protein